MMIGKEHETALRLMTMMMRMTMTLVLSLTNGAAAIGAVVAILGRLAAQKTLR